MRHYIHECGAICQPKRGKLVGAPSAVGVLLNPSTPGETVARAYCVTCGREYSSITQAWLLDSCSPPRLREV